MSVLIYWPHRYCAFSEGERLGHAISFMLEKSKPFSSGSLDLIKWMVDNFMLINTVNTTKITKVFAPRKKR